MDGWTDGRMYGCMDVWMYVCMYVCIRKSIFNFIIYTYNTGVCLYHIYSTDTYVLYI